jgi:hypothetical protein
MTADEKFADGTSRFVPHFHLGDRTLKTRRLDHEWRLVVGLHEICSGRKQRAAGSSRRNQSRDASGSSQLASPRHSASSGVAARQYKVSTSPS